MIDPLDSMVPQLYRVQGVRQETHDTFTLALSLGDSQRFTFAPGQFNMVYSFGTGEVPISISGDPDRASTLIHTIRAVGTVTNAMGNLRGGETLGVRGPFGSRWPIQEAAGNDVVIVAGGIGLAPLRPVIYYLLSHRERYGHITLLYGARTPNDLLYVEELQKWKEHKDIDVEISVDNAESNWHGDVGFVTQLIPRACFTPVHTVVMVCGPEIMMHFTVQEFIKRSISQQNIYLSIERNMKCAVGFCGHCQFGPAFVCKDGPIFSYASIREWFVRREI